MKTAIVTGASTGIGRAVAIELAEEYFVYLVARREDKLQETKRIIEENGGMGEILLCDLSDKTSLHKLVETIRAKTDSVEMLMNIAGIWHGENEVFAETNYDMFTESVIYDTVNVGLIAPMVLSHGIIPLMKNGGIIVNLSGTFENGAKGWLPYYVSKRAIEDFTIGLSQDLQGRNIKVIGISPSDVDTEEYQKYFPEDAKDALLPKEVASQIVKIVKASQSGKVWVLKRGMEPKVDFHY